MHPIPTDHYLERCALRGIPMDAALVVLRHGEKLCRDRDDNVLRYLSPLAAYRASRRGLNLWAYERVAVVFNGLLALTAFRIDDERARQRRVHGGQS